MTWSSSYLLRVYVNHTHIYSNIIIRMNVFAAHKNSLQTKLSDMFECERHPHYIP